MERAVDKIDYKGYTFYRNGKIISPRGIEIQGYFFTYPYSHISIKYDGSTKKYLKAKLMYELFSGEKVSRKYIVRFKDNDPRNCAYENLYLESRKEYSNNHPHTNEPMFNEEKRRKIWDMYYEQGTKEKKKGAPSLRQLSHIFSCSLTTIQKNLEC